MPPKKKPEVSKKTEQKKKEKIIEDKTFGLKNKKGSKQQKFIHTVKTQVQHGNQKTSKVQSQQEQDKLKKKDEKKKLQEEINALFKPVSQTVSKGVDPKSVLCAFFKQGQCHKGDKCKFSHDLSIERKAEKRSIYEDERDVADMNENELGELVNQKFGESNKNKTAGICKHFLTAVENSKYGWFWQCPNGEKCIYKHALPPGFVLKKDQRKESEEEKISIEDLVETERASLGSNTTRVTLESFLKWKERKKREKIENLKVETEKKKADYKAGKVLGISGRQMFEFNPDLVRNDDDEVQDGTIEREKDEDEVKYLDITMDSVIASASEVDSSGTQAKLDRLQEMHPHGMVNGNDTGESGKLDEAAALPPSATTSLQQQQQEESDRAIAAAMSATINGAAGGAGGLEIDEDLFAEEDDDLMDELETLELEEEDS